VFPVLETSEGALMEVYSMEAGGWAVAQATRSAEAHPGYSVGWKGNPPELLREAARGRASPTQPELSSPWEKDQGDQRRSHRSRPTAMEAYLDGSPLKQVWRAEKERPNGKIGQIEREHRSEVTNVHRGRFKAAQIRSGVSSHGAIENPCHWTVDVIWDEDPTVWCGQGVGIQVRGLLRWMADNLVALVRGRSLRTREDARAAQRRWHECCEVVFLLIGGERGARFPRTPVPPGH
jgi:hypothetical protein